MTSTSADPAIYEVVSETIPTADITYFDGTQYQQAEQVSLPWTTEVHVGDLTGKGHITNRAEVRANWPIRARKPRLSDYPYPLPGQGAHREHTR